MSDPLSDTGWSVHKHAWKAKLPSSSLLMMPVHPDVCKTLHTIPTTSLRDNPRWWYNMLQFAMPGSHLTRGKKNPKIIWATLHPYKATIWQMITWSSDKGSHLTISNNAASWKWQGIQSCPQPSTTYTEKTCTACWSHTHIGNVRRHRHSLLNLHKPIHIG